VKLRTNRQIADAYESLYCHFEPRDLLLNRAFIAYNTVMKRGVWLETIGLCLALLATLPVQQAWCDPTTQPTDHKTAIIQIRGEIDDYTRDQLFQRFATARAAGAKTVILDLDTYGGLLTAGLEMSRFIKRQDDLHVIAFVQDKAISAGAMIAMACDEIVMSNSASLGDCAPIIFGPEGLEGMPPTERAKAEAPVLLDFQESAARNHRDPLLAAAMVAIDHAVYWVQDNKGNRQFVDDAKHTELLATKNWIDVPDESVPINGPTTLLTVDSDQAVRYGLASGEARTAMDLASQRNYDIVANLSPGFGDELVEALSGAAVRGLLIIIFLQCLYVVLHAPGHGIAETIGLVALFLMLGVPMLTGYAQWWEILLIFVGLGLVALEIIVPGHFFPGITGGLLILFGLVMTFVPENGYGPLIPHNLHDAAMVTRKGLTVVAIALVSSMALWIWLSRFLPKLPYLNRLIITTTSGRPVSGAPTGPFPAGVWPQVGAIGRAISELRPGGMAEFFDPTISDQRLTSVVSETGFLPPGTEIVVRELAGPSIIVRKKI
jgi:membrane-bound serine protease (ClpP class)